MSKLSKKYSDGLFVTLSAIILTVSGSLAWAQTTAEDTQQQGQFLGAKQTTHPEWFKESFLEFEEDIEEAAEQGKRLVIYFHQDGCPYCNKLVEENFTHPDISSKMQSNFDLVAINMWGDREVVQVGGKSFTEKTLAKALNVNFTPTLIFFNESKEIALRLNGYYPVLDFDHALDYVSAKMESTAGFPEYLATLQENKLSGELIEEDWILAPPYDLSQLSNSNPLAVLFEEPDCSNCQLLHEQTFANPDVLETLNQYNVIQLNRWSDDPVVRPNGARTTAAKWATELGLGFSPAIVLFNPNGELVMTIDALFKTFHVWGVLEYVASGDYQSQPSFQRYLSERAEHMISEGRDVNIWEY